MKIIEISATAGAAIVAAVGIGACGIHHYAPQPTPTVTKTVPAAAAVKHHARHHHSNTKIVAVPAPAPATSALPVVPAPQANGSYATDIANAGIVAPAGWLYSTGTTLCNDWANGQTTTQTDQILLAGGIYPYHLATFDSITQADVCP